MRLSIDVPKWVYILIAATAVLETALVLMSPQGTENFSLLRMLVLVAVAPFMYVMHHKILLKNNFFASVLSILGSLLLLAVAFGLIPASAGYAALLFVQAYVLWIAALNMLIPSIK